MKLMKLLTTSLFTTCLMLLVLPAAAGVGEGQELYDAYCQVCHGGVGEGQTMGKSLVDTSANNLSDKELLEVITNGRSGTGMAAWGSSFSEEEIFDIATYVRALQGKPGLNLSDDEGGISDDPKAVAGRSIFNGKGQCASCHSYDEQGGSVGPALDDVASRLSDSALKQALRDPSASIVSGYGAMQVTQNDGSIITGRFRNDSELAVQIQSEDGRRWVTYFKDRIASVESLERSIMPEIYATLSAAEQQALIAFLKSL